MAQIAALTLADGAATPVNHTFTPGNKVDGIAKWLDKSGGIALGFPAVTMSMREPTKSSRTWKVTAKVVVPTLEVTAPSTATGIQPAPTLAYNCLATIDFVIPERASAAERANILSYVKNFLASTVGDSAIKNLEAVW